LLVSTDEATAEEAARARQTISRVWDEVLPALFNHYNITDADDTMRWFKLAIALARRHVPAVQGAALPSDLGRPPPPLTEEEQRALERVTAGVDRGRKPAEAARETIRRAHPSLTKKQIASEGRKLALRWAYRRRNGQI